MGVEGRVSYHIQKESMKVVVAGWMAGSPQVQQQRELGVQQSGEYQPLRLGGYRHEGGSGGKGSSSGKSSKVRGATLCSTTTERGGDGESGEWQQHRGSHSQ